MSQTLRSVMGDNKDQSLSAVLVVNKVNATETQLQFLSSSGEPDAKLPPLAAIASCHSDTIELSRIRLR